MTISKVLRGQTDVSAETKARSEAYEGAELQAEYLGTRSANRPNV